MSRGSIRRAAIRSTLALVMLAIAGGGVAQADVPGPETGSPGVHWLKEPPSGPADGFGAWCIYGQAAHRLSHVWVKAPVMYAFDAHPGAGNDPQWVGYRARIQRWDGAAWVNLWLSPAAKKQANDNVRAPFSSDPATQFIDYPVPEPGLKLRAIVQMIWYAPGGTVEITGTSRHRVQTYAKAMENAGVAVHETRPCDPIWP